MADDIIYPFQTAIIDPPWKYDRASKNNKLSGYVSQDGNEKYKTMSLGELKELPIGQIVGSYVFLWTVSPLLKDGLELLDTWGFDYITSLAWHKNTGLGVGFWFRGSHELVLVAKRSGAPSIRTGEQSIFASKRLGHSAKPETLHEIIEKQRDPYTSARKLKNGTIVEFATPTTFPGPYVEIFGRRDRSGWTVLGNEAPQDGMDIRESLKEFMVHEQNITKI